MPRKRRIKKRKRRATASVSTFRWLVQAGDPWKRPVPGISAASCLTELLTGHDFFGVGYRGDDKARRVAWDVLRDDVLTARERYAPESPLPWAHRVYDLAEAPPKLKTVTVGGETFTFDPVAAERVVLFFEGYLCHTEGGHSGKPFALMPFQRELLSDFYGWKREDGTRRFADLHLEIPKKNGKSALVSGLSLYHLLADGESKPRVLAFAADRDNARIVFDVAADMVSMSPILSKVAIAQKHKILGRFNRGELKVQSAESYTKHGLNASATIFDELHAQPDRKLWDTLDGAGAARDQPVRLVITTAGWDRNSICWERRERALATLRDPSYDPHLLAKIFTAATDGEDGHRPPTKWNDPELWARANPGMGVTFRADYLAAKAREAEQEPARLNSFLQLHLNCWTEQAVRLIPMDKWDRCSTLVPTDARCLGSGLDLAHTRDCSSWTRIYEMDGDVIGVAADHWIPEADIRRRSERDRVPYDLWARQGRVQSTPGNVTDFSAIRMFILDSTDSSWRDTSDEQRPFIAYDRRFATQLVTELSEEGFLMIPFGQGWNDMSAPTEEIVRRTLAGKIAHGGDPVLRWMASNAAADVSAEGHQKLAKARSNERIDGISALAFALGWHMRQPSQPFQSRWDDPDAEFITF